MAYFSNDSECEVFNSQCTNCIYGEVFCPIAFVQIAYNYDAVNNEVATNILDTLVKNNGACSMFESFKHDFEKDKTFEQTNLKI